MIEGQSATKNAQHPHQKYEKFLNDVYSCIRQKQFVIKRSCTPENHQLLPKLPIRQENIQISFLQDQTNENYSNRAKSQNKSRKFKSFLNILDEHQKKISNENMNLLGLQVKKISYCEKIKKKQKNDADFFDENVSQKVDNSTNSKSHCIRKRKTIDCEKMQDFTCSRMGISHRQIMTMARRHSFNANSTTKTVYKQKPKSGKIQIKRKSISQANNNPVYDGRIKSYRQLIFKISYAHGVYTDMQKDDFQDFQLKNDQKYKAWIGLGNNGNMIKTLIRRRFWWSINEDKNYNVNFMWSQLKNNEYFKKQEPTNLWRSDPTKEWSKPGNIEKQIGQKTLFRKKQKTKASQEESFYKVFVGEEKLKYKELILKHGHKSYRDKKEFLELKQMETDGVKMHNHLINNFYLGNKKALYYNLKQYYDLLDTNVFKRLPLTFHIKKGFNDMQYKRFVAYYKRRQTSIKKQEKEEEGMQKRKMRNVWIVKPGQLTNRGHGITVIDEIYELNHIMKRQNQHENGSEKTFIVQLYIDRPFLYQRRKFDIRHFILITQIHGLMRAYWYKQGYIRTSSYQFDIQNFEREIHLTNDAVQKYTPLYGKFEAANKISYSQFQRYLDTTYPKKKYNFEKHILSQMKTISIDAVRSSYLKLSPQRLKHNFEIFGLDFMIDNQFKPWLIEINTNPCLQVSCPLLSKIIPQMVDQSLRLSLDIVFPPPCNYPNTAKHLAPDAQLQNLNYELIFDEKRDGAELRALFKKTNDNLLEQIGDISEDEVYEDEGKEVKVDELL